MQHCGMCNLYERILPFKHEKQFCIYLFFFFFPLFFALYSTLRTKGAYMAFDHNAALRWLL